MFSGKSEELIRRLRRAEIAGQRALIVKPRIDDRYDIGHVVSHAGAKMRAVAVDEPEDIPGLADGYDVIGIDEVQFFPPEIVLVIDVLVERGMRDRRVRARPGLPRPPVRLDAGAALPRGARRQAAGGLPPLRRAGDDDAAARRRRARSRRRRDDRRRRARLVRGALPRLPRARRAGARDRARPSRIVSVSPSTRDGAAEAPDEPHRDRRAEIAQVLAEHDRSRGGRDRRDVDLGAAHLDARPRRARRGGAPTGRAPPDRARRRPRPSRAPPRRP